MQTRVVPLLPILLEVGCGGVGDEIAAGTNAPEPSTRDSLGIAIVEYTTLDGVDSDSWRLLMRDSVRFGRLGHATGDSRYLLGRAVAATPLSDHRIAVADQLAHAIRVFQSDGVLVETIGRLGEGPGEFVQLVGLHSLASDSLLAIGKLNEWHLFDPAGTHVRSGALRPIGIMFPAIWGVFADGSLAVRHQTTTSSDVGLGVTLQNGSIRYFRTDRTGHVLSEFGTFPSRSRLLARVDGVHPVNPGQAYWIVGPLPGPIGVARGDRFYWSDAGLWEVRVYGSDGSLERIIRFARSLAFDATPPFPMQSYVDRPVTERLERAIEEVRGRIGVGPFSDFTVDNRGFLWLREQVDRDRDPGTAVLWYVFDTEGALGNSVELPAEWRTGQNGLIVGHDYVLALEQNEFMVDSYVQVPLVRR